VTVYRYTKSDQSDGTGPWKRSERACVYYERTAGWNQALPAASAMP